MSVRALLANMDVLKLRKLIRLVVSLLQAGRFAPAAAAWRSRLQEGVQCVGAARETAARDLLVNVLQIILKAMS